MFKVEIRTKKLKIIPNNKKEIIKILTIPFLLATKYFIK
jgi:hypothetical protein